MAFDDLLSQIRTLGPEEQGRVLAEVLKAIQRGPADARASAVGMLEAAQRAMKLAADRAGAHKDRDATYADEVLDVLRRYAGDGVEP